MTRCSRGRRRRPRRAKEPEDEREEAGPDGKAPEESAREAFDEAIEKDDVEDFTRLVDAYAAHPLGAAALPEALRLAVIYQRTAMVKILLERGVNPNPQGGRPRGYTPLMQAAHVGNLEYVRVLLEAGAEVNVANEDERTALDAAESWGASSAEHRAIIELLLARGATRGKHKKP